MLKFGRLVDLEKLETISVNRVAEELKVKLKDENTKNSKEIREWDVSGFLSFYYYSQWFTTCARNPRVLGLSPALLAMCRDELSAVIARLISKCL